MNMLQAVNYSLKQVLDTDPKVLVCGQLVKYGLGGMTEGLYERWPKQIITYPVCENLMHASAMGLALAGYRPIVINERMDFLALAMDPLLNHIAVWGKRSPLISLRLTIIVVVGKGHGQGPQHSKNFAPWLRKMEGLKVVEPDSCQSAKDLLLDAVFCRGLPTVYVLHREFFLAETDVVLPNDDRVGLCGASERHEKAYYLRN